MELYSVEQDQSMRRWLMLGGLLTHALEEGSELSLMYQPIGDVQSRKIVQVEALARWNHPVQGSIPPEEFIGIAEQMGLIPQITDFVLAEGCAQLARWRDAGIRIGLAINVSGREFADVNLVERVAKHLRAHDLPPEVLTLEVTETEVMADLTQASKVLDQLSGLGIKIAIDDYGTGYSSLAYLHELPVQELKIDRSFVTNLPNEASNRIIVRSSIAMAHSLGLKVVAEGAEDELTCSMLAEAQCDFIQGYYLSKPQGGLGPAGVAPGGRHPRVRADRRDSRLARCGDDAPLRVRLNGPSIPSDESPRHTPALPRLAKVGLLEPLCRLTPGGRDSADLRHRLRNRTMPVGWCTIEELVPEHRPTAGQRIAGASRCQKASDCGSGPGPSHQPGVYRSGDAMVGEVFDGESGSIAVGCVARSREDRLRSSTTTGHGLGDPLPLHRVHETRSVAHEKDPSPRWRGPDHPHFEPATEAAWRYRRS